MVTPATSSRIREFSSMIGNTPLMAIDLLYKGEPRVVYAKAENLNMTGSIKDRMAYHILNRGYKRGDLKPQDVIVEATSGNTGIAFSAIGRALGHPVVIFMPDWLSAERINLIKSLGAKIILVSKEEGGFLGSIERAEEMAESRENVFLPRQFSNRDNVEAHLKTTGPEIWWQLKFQDLTPDAFVAGVGTGGTIMGVGSYLRRKNPEIKLYPLEPANSPTLSTGCKVGLHRIQGISDEFIPAILELDQLDEVVSVDDGDAIIMAQKLAGELGLGVGISSGANFLGALKAQNDLGRDAVVTTVFSDCNKKYLSTDLMREEPVEDDFLSPHVQLLNVRAIKRVCTTCYDPQECSVFTGIDVDGEEFIPYCQLAREGIFD
ncbi:MAG: cysteine synthase family protein [Chloroflexota bacterium]|nr:MAG: cysteine synthase family protein [Chloroflexota bacterium]